MKIDFSNQVVLITGSTRGIGKQIADDFAELGASLLLTGTNAKQVVELNKNALANREKRQYFCVDFTSEESVEKFLSEIEKISRIDVVINNAGINENNYIHETKLGDWDNIISVNLTSPFKIMRAIAKKMITQKYGRIINIGSIFGTISKEKRAIYSATKFGIHGLTMGVSNDLARYNVMVNTISPGFVMTDLTKKNLSLIEREVLAKQVPVGRLAETEEISKVVLFIASKWNTYLTGQNILVDGGFTNV